MRRGAGVLLAPALLALAPRSRQGVGLATPTFIGASVLQQLLDLFHKIYDVQGLVEWGGLLGLVAIVFAETGLLVGFFLPGDSLLVTAGIFCSSHNPAGKPLLNFVAVNICVTLAAILGDTVGYLIGAKTGPKIFSRENSLLFNRKHILSTKAFYERHGGKTIIMARFMPIVRTFAPVVAGVGQMDYRQFLRYNVVGGFLWVLSMTALGYGLAVQFPGITKHIDKLIVLIIFVSLLPGFIGWLRGRMKEKHGQSAA
jgi:membrane-associated protein